MDSSTRRRLFAWIQDEAPTLVLTENPDARYPRDVIALTAVSYTHLTLPTILLV
mgnify:CR=1 FL=1